MWSLKTEAACEVRGCLKAKINILSIQKTRLVQQMHNVWAQSAGSKGRLGRLGRDVGYVN